MPSSTKKHLPGCHARIGGDCTCGDGRDAFERVLDIDRTPEEKAELARELASEPAPGPVIDQACAMCGKGPGDGKCRWTGASRAPCSYPPEEFARMLKAAYPQHHADVRQSGARRVDPNTPGLGALPPRERADRLLRAEEEATAQEKVDGTATVTADLVSAFEEGGVAYLLCLPVSGRPVRVRLAPGRLGALIEALGKIVATQGH